MQAISIKKRARRSGMAIIALVAISAGLLTSCSPQSWFTGGSKKKPGTAIPIYEEQGIKQTAAVRDGHLEVYNGKDWNPQFWTGVNMGATTPGHAPGELSPSKEDYLRWF